MNQATLIDLAYLSDTFPETPKDEIEREVYLDSIQRYLETYDVIFLEGDSGIGKTTFLTQFVKANSLNTVSYFIIPSLKFSYDPISLKNSLYKQLQGFLIKKQ